MNVYAAHRSTPRSVEGASNISEVRKHMEHQKLLYFTPKPTLSKNVRATRRAIQSTLVKGKTNLVFACLSDPIFVAFCLAIPPSAAQDLRISHSNINRSTSPRAARVFIHPFIHPPMYISIHASIHPPRQSSIHVSKEKTAN